MIQAMAPGQMRFGYEGDQGLGDRLVEAVLRGERWATSSLRRSYGPDEALPGAGQRYVLVDSAGRDRGVVEIAEVWTLRFGDVGPDVAVAEGEGTVEAWRQAHRELWAATTGRAVEDDEMVVVELFRLVPPNAREAGRMWDQNAPAWIELSRAGFDVYRDLVNSPAFFAMLPDVSGALGLDLGCGEGHNTRLLTERGARVVGLDVSVTFAAAAAAEERQRPVGMAVVVGDGLAFPFPSGAFDFVVAFMSLMDMPHPGAVLVEAARALRPGGFLQFSILHPFIDAAHRRWVTDEGGRRVGLEVRGYFDPSPTMERWTFSTAPPELEAAHEPFVTPRFPMTMSGWLNALAEAGLVVEKTGEPCADEETAARHPEVADTRVAPFFLHVRARK